jgi:hypothetical protein
MELRNSGTEARRLPARRWLSRGVVLEFIQGTWRDLRKLEAEGKLTPEYPGGITHKRYRRDQVLTCGGRHEG